MDTPFEEPSIMDKTIAENCPTVSLVPPESSNGKPSYALVVQDVNKPNVKLDIKCDQGKNEEEMVNNASKAESKQLKKRAPFTCNFCTYSSHRQFLVLRHLKTHSNERPHKCDVCERGFKTAGGLQNHMNTHNGVKPKVCNYCNNRYTTSGELIRHIRYIHTHEKPHKCTQCDYAAVEMAKLRRHLLLHTGERPYQCQHCTYASPDSFKLKRHLRSHTREKPYKCDMCSLCFTQLNSMKVHRLKHKGSEKPVYQCDLCLVKCSRKADLRMHLQKLHSSDKPHECKRCGKSFPDRYSCKVHNKTHQGEKSFKCEICPYASATSHYLKAHLLKHTEKKPFSCDLCDESFKLKRMLHHHHDLYHNPDYVPKPRKKKTLLCNKCNQTFAHKGHLISHLAIHNHKTSPQEQALAHKQGRQKKVIAAETFKNMKPNGTESSSLVKVFEEDDDGNERIILPEVKKLMPIERSIRLEEVETCFGVEEENQEEEEKEEEVFGAELVFESL